MKRNRPLAPRWDFFIAHAGADQRAAERLFEYLDSGSEVFLDSKRLLPGDDWDSELAKAQAESRITVVLISSRTGAAYYQREEIAAAIALARVSATQHRVVPVYLQSTERTRAAIPYGLRLKHAITVTGKFSLRDTAEKLLELRASLDSATRSRAGTDSPAEAAGPDSLSAVSLRARSRIEQYLADVDVALSRGIVDRQDALERAGALCFLAAKEYRAAELTTDDVESVFYEGSQGSRMTALALATEAQSAEFLPMALLSIREPLTPWEQFRALGLAYELLPLLGELERGLIDQAVRSQMGSAPGQYLNPTNEGRWDLANRLLRELRRPAHQTPRRKA
jgi:TIR domain